MSTPDLSEMESRPQGRRQWSGWGRSLVLPLMIVAAIVGLLLYFQSRAGSDASDAGTSYGIVELPAAKNATGRPPAAEVGRAAPDFALERLDGGSLRLSDLQGQPVLVNFWASWCSPCRQETPELILTYEKQRSAGLVVLGVNLREADGPAGRFASDFGIDYPVVMDRRGEVAKVWRVGGPVEGIPASYFIDKNGVVQKVVYGAVRPKDLEEGLALILGRQ